MVADKMNGVMGSIIDWFRNTAVDRRREAWLRKNYVRLMSKEPGPERDAEIKAFEEHVEMLLQNWENRPPDEED